ncbi:MAG: hypothetical protein IJP71_00810 [Lachnospiraceae bacterium]|nr:hypothetical protein [Lachnospiraceae bacterium]
MVETEKEITKIDIDKQIWLAKQKEISEYKIIKRRKKRKMYWIWKKIFILLAIIAIIILAYWEEITRWIQMK